MNQLRDLRSPLSVNYAVTDVCNLFCEFCLASACPLLNHPPLKKVFRILDELSRAEVFEIRLFGGEFFSYPYWEEVIRYAYEKGFFLSFVSNGTLIDDYKVKVMKECGVKGGAISIHGPKAIHDKITQHDDAYELAIAGLKACLDGGLEVCVLSTIIQDNKNSVLEMLADLNSKGLIRAGVSYATSRLNPFGRGTYDWDSKKLVLKDYFALFETLSQVEKTYGISASLGDAFPECLVPKKYRKFIQGCWQGTGFGSIGSNGEVKGCTVSDTVFGNLLETPLETIWQGPKLKEFRSLGWLPNSCQKCKTFCGGGCSASRISAKPYAVDEFLKEPKNANQATV
ncbi:MAG: radical SAM protein [Candidatus Saccharibacteria bacterium]|nr:radical SAM protein [Candidatus Saccharibacteria bacterium]